ncbi:MAG: peptide chain release factor N(5)-glutamine methyltransferase [Anaerolineae bacterium]
MENFTVRAALQWAAPQIKQAGSESAQLDAEVLLCHTLRQERAWLFAHPHTPLSPAQSATFRQQVNRRLNREPVAYIVQQRAFFGLDFWVTPDVLIPRPETELLVETALQLAGAQPGAPLTIADVGTGSGCIAVSLARHLPRAVVWAVDISPGALAVAERNAKAHGVAGRITFAGGDLLAPLPGPFDVIASNPPYVAQADLTNPATMPEVRRFEPHLALDGGPSGLQVIERLLCQAAEKLRPTGSLLVEIGFNQGQAARALAQRHFPKAAAQIKQDLAGLDRLLVVRQQG